jgi:uncharacterized membrane protein
MPVLAWFKHHLSLVIIMLFLCIIGIIIIGLFMLPEVFYDQWIWRYYWGPIVADAGGTPVHNGVYVQEGYTFVSELTYGIILIVALFGIYKLLKYMKIALDWPFFMALLPYILFGPVSRVLEDAVYFNEPFVYWFISPLIYVQIAVFALGFIVIGYFALHNSRQKGSLYGMIGATVIIYLVYLCVWIFGVDYGAYIIHPLVMGMLMIGALLPVFIQVYRKKLTINTLVFSGGLILLLPTLYLTARWIVGYQWDTTTGVRFDVFLLISILVAIITSMVFLIGYRWRNNPKVAVFKHPLNLAMIVGHMVDGLTSYVSIYDPLRMGIPLYVEKHPASDLLMQLWPPLFPIVKFLLIIGIIYVFDILYKEDLQRYGWFKNLLKIGIIILGFSPGVRDLLRVTLGV